MVKGAAFAVFQPFLCGLVAADVKVPGNFGHIFKVLRLVDIYFADAVFSVGDPVLQLRHDVVAAGGIAGNKLCQLPGFPSSAGRAIRRRVSPVFRINFCRWDTAHGGNLFSGIPCIVPDTRVSATPRRYNPASQWGRRHRHLLSVFSGTKRKPRRSVMA